MVFDVGGIDYVVVRRHVINRGGKLRQGYCDGPNRQILICGTIRSEVDVLRVLRHEHRHAWEYESGICQGCPDSRASFGVIIARTFDRDWHRTGGLAALLALPIGGALALPVQHKASAKAMACQHCGYTMIDGHCLSCE